MDIKENDWGITEGLSFAEVDAILSRNGFQKDRVALPAQFGPDPPGYSYPCWRNKKRSINAQSTFHDGKLVAFSWNGPLRW